MSVITHVFENAVIGNPTIGYPIVEGATNENARAPENESKNKPASSVLFRLEMFAATAGRYVVAVFGGALLALAMAAPVSALPGAHENVYSGLSFLLALAWFVALNYVRQPWVAALLVALGVFGLVGAMLSLSSTAWLWAGWSVNVLAGLAGLFAPRHPVAAPLVAGWIGFNASLMAVVGSVG